MLNDAFYAVPSKGTNGERRRRNNKIHRLTTKKIEYKKRPTKKKNLTPPICTLQFSARIPSAKKTGPYLLKNLAKSKIAFHNSFVKEPSCRMRTLSLWKY